MSQKMKRIMAVAVSMMLIVSSLSGCESMMKTQEANRAETTTIVVEEAVDTDILQDALIYTLPLMIMDATCIKATNVVEATDMQAPINQMFHAKNLATAEFTDVVTPNVDTIYSQAFLDLSKDAVVFEFPKTERFCTVQVMDAYTNTIAVLDLTEQENDTRQYIFTGKNFDGEVPESMQQIVSPTSMAWVLVRTICNGSDDVENVYQIQNQMDAYTWTQYVEETTDEKPEGTFDENNNFNPLQHVMQMSMQDYFTRANQLMAVNPPEEEDTELMERLSEIQVGPGLVFDASLWGDNPQTVWAELLSGAADACLQESLQYMVKNGCWTYYGAPIAEFGTAYDYRGLISLAGFGANPVSVAVYPKAEHDSNGERLNGENQYVLHFEADQLPPVKDYGFWSVTAYDSSNNLLIDNELDRYCINDRSELVYNEDGSLDIYIQSDRPDEAFDSNWLPVSEGEFHFVLRIYFPVEDVINNVWEAPTIMKR